MKIIPRLNNSGSCSIKIVSYSMRNKVAKKIKQNTITCINMKYVGLPKFFHYVLYSGTVICSIFVETGINDK